jgi:hypothetical protein
MNEEEKLQPPGSREALQASHSPADLPQGLVAESLGNTVALSGGRIGRWSRALETRAMDEREPDFIPFTESGPDALETVESLLEAAVGGDPSLTGMLKGLGSGLLTMVEEPIAAITDDYQVGKIKELQAKFLRENGPTLLALDEALRNAKARMRELSELLNTTPVDWVMPGHLLAEKSTVGNLTLSNIERALERTKDPQERARLESLRDEMTQWMAQRDARVEAERPEVDELRERLSELEQTIAELRSVMHQAATSAGPRTDTGGQPGGPFAVVNTSHHRPDAVAHVVSLHDLLLGARAKLTQAITPWE